MLFALMILLTLTGIFYLELRADATFRRRDPRPTPTDGRFHL